MKLEDTTAAVPPPFEQGVMAQVPERLDGNGRCCGRKPLHYKGSPRPRLFCSRCDREFDPATGVQRANWAWKPAQANARRPQDDEAFDGEDQDAP